MTNIKLELFHANWCGHCKTFLPEWKKFAKEISNDAHVTVADYEHSAPNFNQFANIDGKAIAGFPTVKITVNGSEYEYNKERTAESLHNTVKELKQAATQSGGAMPHANQPHVNQPHAKKQTTGGSVFTNTSIKAPDKSDPDYSNKILLYKIAKYEYKYNKLYNELRNKGVV